MKRPLCFFRGWHRVLGRNKKTGGFWLKPVRGGQTILVSERELRG